MGSPAVSYSSRNSIRVTMSAFFFDRFAAAAGVASAARGDVESPAQALVWDKECGPW